MTSNETCMAFSDAFKEAKARLSIPELWRKLDLPGEPSKKCKSPFRDEKTPSFGISKEGTYWKDHGGDGAGDIFDFYEKAMECDKAEAVRAIFAMLNLKADNPGLGWGKPPKKPEVVSLTKLDEVGRHRVDYDIPKLPQKAIGLFLSKGINPASAIERVMEGSMDVEGGKLVFNYNTGRKIRGSWESSKENRWIEGGADDALWRISEVWNPEVTHVFITEGETDCMKVLSTVDPPLHVAVVAAPAASWRPSSILAGTIGHGRKVVLAFDNDKAGEDGASMVSSIIHDACDGDVSVQRFPWKQIEKYFDILKSPYPKDLCDLTQEMLRKTLDRCFE